MRRGKAGAFFEVFSVREKGEHPVASKWRWDEGQKQRRPQKEIDWKGQSPEVGDRRKWLAAHEDVAKIRMLKYLEDNQDLKGSLRDLNVWKKQISPSFRLPNRQGMREASNSSISLGRRRMWCTSPVGRGGMHN